MENLFETLGAALRPQTTAETDTAALIAETERLREQLAHWEAGGILWTWEDVETYASNELYLTLSEEQCRAILKAVIGAHDPDCGITWADFHKAIEAAAETEAQKKARLIAAAPELLAALQNLLSSYRADFSNITGAALNPTEAVIMAERAIHNAKF